jgi:hypothetical protein
MRLLTLHTALRDAGVEAVEVDGWRTRGYDFDAKPKVVVGHHTASSPKGGAMPSLGILIDGRTDLPGPLCQIGLSRKGVAYVIASGKANHAGPGQWRNVDTSSLTVGIEAENDGVGEPWPDVQLQAFDLCAAVLLDLLDQPAFMYCGHREWATPTGRKIDPTGIDLDQQRGRIARILEEGIDMPLSDADLAKIRDLIEESEERTIRRLMLHKLRTGDAVGTILRNVEARTERLVEMHVAATPGNTDVASIAAAVRKELSRALEE